MNKRVLTIGSAMQDIFIEYPCTDLLTLHSVTHPRSFVLLEEGIKLTVDTLSYKTGGGATNSAVSFSKLGFSTAIFCKVGTDEAAHHIVTELNDYNINTRSIIATQHAHTGTSFIIPCPSGNRAVLVYRGANLTLQQHELPLPMINTVDCVYITSLSGPTAPFLTQITQYAKNANKCVAVNPGTSQMSASPQLIIPALGYIDIFILNLYEATVLMQILKPGTALDIKHFLQYIRSHGPQTVVITDGAQGVHVLHNGTYLYHPSMPINVVSTLGAGDAFGSAFVASLLKEYSIEDAIRAGIINSASVLSHADCKAGLLDTKNLYARVKTINQTLLQKQ